MTTYHTGELQDGFELASGERSAPPGWNWIVREIASGLLDRTAWTAGAVYRLIAVFTLLFVSSWAGIMLSHASEGVATIWLSNGILFGLMMTRPPSEWLGYFAVGLAADTSADLVYGDPFVVAIGVSMANCVEVVAASLGLTKLCGYPLQLSRLRPLLCFLLVAVLGATALSSLIGAAWTVTFVAPGPFLSMFRTWYLGDMLGMALLAPMVFMLQRPGLLHIFRRKELLQTSLVLGSTGLVTLLVFMDSHDPMIFFLFPALLLVVFRLGFPGTVFAILLIAVETMALTIRGNGPLMLIPGDHMLLHRIVVLQILLAVTVFSTFPVAIVLEQRDAFQASLAQSERQLRYLAHRDDLTGLHNRRAFNRQLDSVWRACLEQGETLSLLMLDADAFKAFNDLYGHVLGDECLRTLAKTIDEVARCSDGFVSRFGGEEFVVLLTSISHKKAIDVASEVRQAVERANILHAGSSCGVQTVSLGVATMVPAPGMASDDLVRAADRALYHAKLRGRNQVAVA